MILISDFRIRATKSMKLSELAKHLSRICLDLLATSQHLNIFISQHLNISISLVSYGTIILMFSLGKMTPPSPPSLTGI